MREDIIIKIKEFLKRYTDRKTFSEYEVKMFLKESGFSVPDGIFIRRGEVILPVELSYPLAAKVSSSKITSKSDISGIRLGIKDEAELEQAVAELMRIEHAEGVLVEEMCPAGIEVIIGGTIDQQFGPVVMFGLGGVYVELFRDVSFGLAPLDKDGASWLINQIKGYKILEGYRGKPPVDLNSLASIIIAVSEIMAANLIKEINLNPVAVYPEGAIVLDAKMQVIF